VREAAVSHNPGGERGVSPYTATASVAEWPGEAGDDGAAAADLDDGRQLYLATCAACHGAGGQGLPNQGPDLRGSAFVGDSSDDALHSFLASGRPAGDSKNRSGLPMPPRGGNPSLSDRHLQLIIKFLRTMKSGQNGDTLGSAAEQSVPAGRP
jgi:disulfide bond formation protein DsbB